MLLDASLTVEYPGRPPALSDVRLALSAGEIFGLAGESGSGKSTLALALLGLLESRARVTGRVLFEGEDLLSAPRAGMRAIRGKKISLVLQSPVQSLNPALRIGTQLSEAWRVHERGADGSEQIRQALEDASLPADRDFLRLYPNQLSVGMAQRVLIAMAVLHRPGLIVADEPTSALDVITQAEILALFERLNRVHGTAVLFITHDLAAAAMICHRIAVLHRGAIVESGPAAAVLENPAQEYTRRLVAAIPGFGAGRVSRRPGASVG